MKENRRLLSDLIVIFFVALAAGFAMESRAQEHPDHETIVNAYILCVNSPYASSSIAECDLSRS